MARHFSKEEIEEIRAALSVLSAKDSDFPRTDSVNDDDLLPVVQGGVNKTVGIRVISGGIEDRVMSYVDGEISAKAVRYDKEQTLSDGQKAQARKNIGALEDADGAVTEEKISEPLKEKVNYNVKFVKQTLGDEESRQAQINVRLRDGSDNVFFSPTVFKEAVSADWQRPHNSVFGAGCKANKFGADCWNNSFKSNCRYNQLYNGCSENVFGDYCESNLFKNNCYGNVSEYGCYDNTLGEGCYCNTFGSGCNYISLNGSGCHHIRFVGSSRISFSQHNLNNITVLRVQAELPGGDPLKITVPSEYLNRSRHLIVTSKSNQKVHTADDLVFYFADEVITHDDLGTSLALDGRKVNLVWTWYD